MKTLVLPAIWYLSATGSAVAVLISAHSIRIHPYLALGLAWICSIFAALFVGIVAVRVKPDLRFSTRQQVDGHGYLHEPLGVVVNITVIAAMAFLICLF